MKWVYIPLSFLLLPLEQGKSVMMRVSVALLMGTSVFVGAQIAAAQSEPAGAAVSREQIHCFVAGGCNDAAPPTAAKAKSDDDACMETGDCSVGETKGFHLTTGTAAAAGTARPSVRAPSRPAYAAAASSTPRAGRMASPAPALSAPRQSLNMRLSFELNSAHLTPEARQRADIFASELKSAAGGRRFAIEGHTDNVGNPAYNQRLSRERAQAVVDYLVAQGVPASRLQAVGYGFAHPLDGSTASDPNNRRVEITRF